jgi:hypothetical protein
VFISLFEVTNPAISRDRQPLQLSLWSLALGLVLFAGVHRVYAWADWPRNPLDPQFYAGLLVIAALGGYTTGRTAGSNSGREWAHRLRFLVSSWVWVEVMRSRPSASRTGVRYVVVHLLDGTKLYGYPRYFTDDPRETVREVYLEQPHVFGGEAGKEAYLPLPRAAGVLIESSQVQFIEFLEDA